MGAEKNKVLFTKQTSKMDATWKVINDTEIHFDYNYSRTTISNDDNGCNHPNGSTGQIANTKKLHYLPNPEKERIYEYAKKYGGTPKPAFIIPKDTEIKFLGTDKWGITYGFEVAEGKFKGIGFTAYLADFRSKLTGILKDDSNTEKLVKYKIFYKGKAYKPKYFKDIGKIKSSLLISFGYFQNQYETFMKYKDRNPELEDNGIDYWYGGGADFKRSDCKDIQIMEYKFGSKTPTIVDFDVTEYYDQSMKLIDVTAKFGNAAREVFKHVLENKDFSYILVYIPDEYRDENVLNRNNWSYYDFKAIKESQKIKDLLKENKIKDIKKSTKYGKTAIGFKSLDDMKNVIFRLNNNEFFVLDCDGDELVEYNQRFIKLTILKENIKQNKEKIELEK